MEQLCWNCKNTNRFKCSWFDEDAKLPECCEIKNNFIVKCQNYKPIEKNKKMISDKEIALSLGISIRTFYRHKDKYLKKFFDLIPPPSINVNFNK